MKSHLIGLLVFLWGFLCFFFSGFFVGKAHSAHFLHTTPITMGPNVVEASKIEAIFIISQPDDLVIEATVKNGRYDTVIGATMAAAGNTGDDSVTSDGSYSDKNRSRVYTVKIAVPGILGVAAISWDTNKGDDEGGPVIVPVSGVVGVGTKGVQMTFGAGPDGVLSLDNSWTVICKRNFVETAPSQHLIFRGVKSASLAASAIDISQKTLFGVVVKKAYGAIGSELGWSGSIQAMDEF